MQINNDSKYINTLQMLNSDVEKKEDFSYRIGPLALSEIEDIMKKMEWDLTVAINSCITHTVSINKGLSFERYSSFDLHEKNESIPSSLTIKNENRITSLAEENSLDYNERFVSYVLTESIRVFYIFLLKADENNNEQE